MPSRDKRAVLIAAGASRVERRATYLFAQHLTRSTGVQVHVSKAKGPADVRSAIAVLGTPRDRRLIMWLCGEHGFRPMPGPQQYSIRSLPKGRGDGRVLLLYGGDERGVLYAVQDLCRYYWPTPDKSLNPPHLSASDGPAFPKRGAQSWDYFLVNPQAYLDRLSSWKLNRWTVFMWRYLYERIGLIDYAHSRGVDVIVGMGIYSWEFTGVAVHPQQSLLPDQAPSSLRRAPQGLVLCPSERKTREWTLRHILDVLNKLPGIDGFYFQTGLFDFADCSCAKCRRLSPAELFLIQANPVIETVARERPDLEISYGVATHHLADGAFFPALSRVDPRALLLLENRYPVPNARDMARLDRAVPGNYGLVAKVYGQNHLVRGWRERRESMTREMFESIALARSKGAKEIAALIETREYWRRDLYLPAVFAEAAWCGGEVPHERLERVRAVTDSDPRVSDPPVTVVREKERMLLTKRPDGTRVDGGWDWGSLRIFTRLTANICDLLSGGECAEYTFHLPRGFRPGLARAELILRGAKDDVVEDQRPYTFDISVNGRALPHVASPWRKGRKVRRIRTEPHYEATKPPVYEGISDWSIGIPARLLRPTTKIRLKLLREEGLVMCDRMTLILHYAGRDRRVGPR